MKLNYKRTFFVGFAFFLICTFWQAYDTIIPKILTDKFGLSQTVSGAIMAIDNILALFMLPLFGSISDKCKSKKGKRTPFILIGTVVACAVFICMSFADNAQLAKIESVAPGTEGAQTVLYNADLTIKTNSLLKNSPTSPCMMKTATSARIIQIMLFPPVRLTLKKQLRKILPRLSYSWLCFSSLCSPWRHSAPPRSHLCRT